MKIGDRRKKIYVFPSICFRICIGTEKDGVIKIGGEIRRRERGRRRKGGRETERRKEGRQRERMRT